VIIKNKYETLSNKKKEIVDKIPPTPNNFVEKDINYYKRYKNSKNNQYK